MPLHEYLCQDCQGRFEAITTTAKADQVPCPTCSGSQTRRLISVIAGVGGRTAGGFDPSGYAPAPSGGCCGGGGGCACSAR